MPPKIMQGHLSGCQRQLEGLGRFVLDPHDQVRALEPVPVADAEFRARGNFFAVDWLCGTCRANNITTQGGRAANQWVLPHRCQLKIVKKLTIFEVRRTENRGDHGASHTVGVAGKRLGLHCRKETVA